MDSNPSFLWRLVAKIILHENASTVVLENFDFSKTDTFSNCLQARMQQVHGFCWMSSHPHTTKCNSHTHTVLTRNT